MSPEGSNIRSHPFVATRSAHLFAGKLRSVCFLFFTTWKDYIRTARWGALQSLCGCACFLNVKTNSPLMGFSCQVVGGWLVKINVYRGVRVKLWKRSKKKKKQRGRFLSEKSLKDNFLGLVLYNELYRELKRERDRESIRGCRTLLNSERKHGSTCWWGSCERCALFPLRLLCRSCWMYPLTVLHSDIEEESTRPAYALSDSSFLLQHPLQSQHDQPGTKFGH